jgi:hypothetical protein
MLAWAVRLSKLPLDLHETDTTKFLRVEWWSTGEELVEQHTERVDVGPRVDVEVRHLRLLGTHVLRCADHLTQLGVDSVLGETL